MEFDEETEIPENAVAIATAIVIERFAVTVPAPMEYYDTVTAMLDSDFGKIRRAGAITLGSMGYYHSENVQEIVNKLSIMIEDEDRGAREAAVRALQGPAIIDQEAYELLKKTKEGLDPDLSRAAEETIELVEEMREGPEHGGSDEEIPLQISGEELRM